MVTEAQILRKIKLLVPLVCPEVVWMDRLQSGTIKQANRYIHMCKPGTPDLYAIIKHKGGHLLFIECKSPKGRQSFDQKRFEYMVKKFDNIHYIVAKAPKDVIDCIEKIIKGDKKNV